MIWISRRRCLLALGGVFVTLREGWAQRPESKARIGVLRTAPPESEQYKAFVLGLRNLGYVEGKNLEIDYRFGKQEDLSRLAEELARAKVSLIFAPTPPGVQAARKLGASIPIVFAVVGDPVRTGIAASLARPGGNMTGLTALGSDLSGKRLEILKEIAPGLSRVAVLWNPALPDKVMEWQEMQGPARALGLELLSIEVRAAADAGAALARAAGLRAEALIVLPEPLAFSQKERVIAFAAKARLPTIYAWHEAAEAGALIAYGADISDLYRRSAIYVDKILRGAKPGDLPIEQPTKFDLAVNLKTAKALGLRVPQSILLRADRLIE